MIDLIWIGKPYIESRPDRHLKTEALVNQVFMRVFLFSLTVSLTVLKDNAFFVNVNKLEVLSVIFLSFLVDCWGGYLLSFIPVKLIIIGSMSAGSKSLGFTFPIA